MFKKMKFTNKPIKLAIFISLFGSPWLFSLLNSDEFLKKTELIEDKSLSTVENFHSLTLAVITSHLLHKAICKKPFRLNLKNTKVVVSTMTTLTGLVFMQTYVQFF
jgi:hypothetical protein